ncbi:MAG: hypothetical protein ACP5NX_00380 [Candidatus Bilamarchaeaceae archaeon]
MSQVYDQLNKAWKSTAKVIFGDEIGDLSGYEKWLMQYVVPPRLEHSSVSKKDVYLANDEYCKKADFIRLDEVDFKRSFAPLNINEIKDIDSIVEAVKERAVYTGNIVLGNSHFIDRCANVNDSSFVYNSAQVWDSKYVAYTYISKFGEYVFGSNGIGETSYCIRSYETYGSSRCFEMWNCRSCSDVYYIYGCDACQETMFSFNVQGKRYMIGNHQLGKDKYLQLKKKLLEEMRGELEAKKKLTNIVDLIHQAKIYEEEYGSIRKRLGSVKWKEKPENKGEIEKAFSHTSQIILGKPLHNIDDYADWFGRHLWGQRISKSGMTGRRIVTADYCCLSDIPERRLIKRDEWELIKEGLELTESEAEQLSIGDAAEKIGKIAFLPFDYEVNCKNVMDCSTALNSTNGYRVIPFIHSKNCGITSWARSSENLFGCSSLFESAFCIGSYLSDNLNRCFEVDTSKQCSDLYFSHNCENVQDSMFCFNVKNLHYSIGNAPLQPDKFKSIKSSLLNQIHGEFDRDKKLKWDIYSIGCR